MHVHTPCPLPLSPTPASGLQGCCKDFSCSFLLKQGTFLQPFLVAKLAALFRCQTTILILALM